MVSLWLAMSTAVARVQPGNEALQGGELFVMQLPFEPVQPSASLVATWDGEPGRSFGPFDEARFGFRAAKLPSSGCRWHSTTRTRRFA